MVPFLQYGPTAVRNFVLVLGLYKACELATNFKTWAGSWLPSETIADTTANKTIVAANSTLTDYSNIAGLWGAFWSCPWSLTSETYRCFQTGFSKNPVTQTVSMVLTPIRFVGNTGFCFVNESGFTNTAGCIFGLDENGKTDLEEKVHTIFVIALLLGCWYLTHQKKNKTKNGTQPS